MSHTLAIIWEDFVWSICYRRSICWKLGECKSNRKLKRHSGTWIVPFLLVTHYSMALCTKPNPATCLSCAFILDPSPQEGERTSLEACMQTHTQQHWHKHPLKWQGNTFGQAQMTVTASGQHKSQHGEEWKPLLWCCCQWQLQQMELQQQQWGR